MLTCINCENSRSNTVRFKVLSLPLPPKNDNDGPQVNLVDCINEFLKRERLDTATDCEHCGTQETTDKHTVLSQLPPVLILQPKLFESDGGESRKVDRSVRFPLEV